MSRHQLSFLFLLRHIASLVAVTGMLGVASIANSAEPSSLRNSAVVRAVQQARRSVVNIHGQKVVRADDQFASEPTRRVNGMGTGVVIDGRGYVLTNYHVVNGVRRIRVTLANGQPYIARLVAHDPVTDLAIIKIPVKQRMPVINVGTSQDILTGETVIAMGNAYGYEHTVSRGIVSAQHRSVRVNDSQNYHDLIQTDASINPGNSGGPLLNIEGQMIGINVAVRVGAQGIGFAIPVNKAMQVAARLMSVERISGIWHGLVPEDVVRGGKQVVVVRDIKSGSPAQDAGIKQGDVIVSVAGKPVGRALDVECALLGSQSGESVEFAVQRGSKPVEVALALSTIPSSGKRETIGGIAWNELGVRLSVVPVEKIKDYSKRFRGGLRITSIRGDGAAFQQGIREGDILVGMHTWETISMENLAYILTKSNLKDVKTVKFYILRGAETRFGNLPVTWTR